MNVVMYAPAGRMMALATKIRGEHPGRLVLRGAQAARDVRQRDVGDGGVEHLHERRKRNRHGDDPRD
jgi:hypothetical protein